MECVWYDHNMVNKLVVGGIVLVIIGLLLSAGVATK